MLLFELDHNKINLKDISIKLEGHFIKHKLSKTCDCLDSAKYSSTYNQFNFNTPVSRGPWPMQLYSSVNILVTRVAKIWSR